jgi:uncharacterized cupredoxin-like copper-binding protein
VAVVGGSALTACGGSDNDSDAPVASPAQSSNAPAIATATAQSELEDTWTPTPEPEVAEGEGEGEAAGPVALNVSAVDIAYDVNELSAPADTDFTITLTNDGAADHDLVIEGTDFKTAILAAGESETITVNLAEGEYTFFCSVPGHRAAGMEGTLTVTPGAAAPAGEEPAETTEAEGEEVAPAAEGAASGETVALEIEAVDIAYDKKELMAPADTEFTIVVTNNGAAPHDFVIENTEFKTAMLSSGQSETLTITLPSGEYTYFCSVPGHRQAGMEGTLIITEVAPPASGGGDAGASTPAPASGGEPVALEIEAVDIAYDTKELAGPAGVDFTITVNNNGLLQHDFVIEDTDFATALLNSGESETITVNLPAGEYTYFCSVPGHRQAGMEGKLTITEGALPASGGGDAGASAPAPASGGATVALEIEAVDIAYDTKQLAGPAGVDFTITVTNNGAAQHDFVIEDTDFATAFLNGGESETITVNLPAGEYIYFCSVPGHRPAGMEGTLTIS